MYCLLSGTQLLRVQSSDGTKRVEILPNASLQELYDSVELAFQLNGDAFALYRQRNYTNEVGSRAAVMSSAMRNYSVLHGRCVCVIDVHWRSICVCVCVWSNMDFLFGISSASAKPVIDHCDVKFESWRPVVHAQIGSGRFVFQERKLNSYFQCFLFDNIWYVWILSRKHPNRLSPAP